jgi:hypothetical protein
MSVPKAGRRYYGLSKNASYEAARRGEIPVIRVGRKLLAVVPAIERMLNGEIEKDQSNGG